MFFTVCPPASNIGSISDDRDFTGAGAGLTAALVLPLALLVFITASLDTGHTLRQMDPTYGKHNTFVRLVKPSDFFGES
jgi:hypothetical protein